MDALAPNSTIGRYRLTEFIGRGGMGQVFGARNVDTGELVAVKALDAEVFGTQAGRERFRNEAFIQYNLNHPAIAKLYEYLECAGQPCIVMEYVDGQTLEERLRFGGPLSWREAIPLFRELVKAVGYVHRCGVVHRDLKASNVKITRAGNVKILDFGIAYEEHVAGLTRVGHVIGTLENLAPEQVMGGKGNVRTDIWSLGILLYQMLTARMPFEDSDQGKLTEKILKGNYMSARQLVADVPAPVQQLIEKCLKRSPSERFATTDELSAALDGIDRPRLRLDTLLLSRWTWAGVGLLATGSVVALILTSLSPREPGTPRRTSVRTTQTHAPKIESQPLPPTVRVSAAPAKAPAVNAQTPARRGQPRDEAQLASTRVDVPRRGLDPVVQAQAPLPAPATPPAPRPQPPVAPPPSAAGKQVIVVIEATNGAASVYMDAIRLGETPYRIGAQVGVTLDLVLKRPGFKDKVVRISAGDRPGPYRYLMEPR